jgi:hypothetical protein
MAWARARRPKPCKLANNPRLRQAVASKSQCSELRKSGIDYGVSIAIDVWMRGRARSPLEEDLAVDPKVSGFLLGFDLDDEVNVVPDRTQKGLHAEVGALESAAGRKAGGVDLVEWVLPDFIYNNVERNRLGHAVQGQFPGDRSSASSFFKKSLPTYVISGNSVVLNQSAPLRSLSRIAANIVSSEFPLALSRAEPKGLLSYSCGSYMAA